MVLLSCKYVVCGVVVSCTRNVSIIHMNSIPPCILQSYARVLGIPPPPAPLLSSTLAFKVHRAVLRGKDEDGINGSRDVAVKVRHPEVLRETFIDVDLMHHMLMCSDVISMAVGMKGTMQCPVDRLEFRRVLQKQFDFRWEAYNLSQFSFNFLKEIKQGVVSFPVVCKRLLSPTVRE